MNKPLISIVTISYNQGKYLTECLDSVASQNFRNYEHIIVDDGSTDGSREIIKSFGDKVVPIFKDNPGPPDSLNKGFDIAQGKIFGYINSDDYLLENALQNVAELFDKYNNEDVIYGNGIIVSSESNFCKRMISKSFSMNKYRFQRSQICQQATFFKSSAFKSIGGFNKENRSSWDFELFADMFVNNFSFKKVDTYLGAFRIYPGTLTGSKDKTISKINHKRMFKKYFYKEFSFIDKLNINFYYIMDRILNLNFYIQIIQDFFKSKKKIKTK